MRESDTGTRTGHGGIHPSRSRVDHRSRRPRRSWQSALVVLALIVSVGTIGTLAVGPGAAPAAASGGRCGPEASTALLLTEAIEAWENAANPCTDIVFAAGGPLSIGGREIGSESNKDLNIVGNGRTLTDSSIIVSINGDLTVDDLDFRGNYTISQLFAITPGDITVTDSTFADALISSGAVDAETIFLLPGGGATLVSGSISGDGLTPGAGTITVTRSSFTDNTADIGGLAVFTTGRVVISEVDVSDNTGNSVGGMLIGAEVDAGPSPTVPVIEITKSSFTENQSGFAGGLLVLGEDVLLDEVLVVGNIGNLAGGGYLVGTDSLEVSRTVFVENAGGDIGTGSIDSAVDDFRGIDLTGLAERMTASDLLTSSDLGGESIVGVGAALLSTPDLTLDETTVAANIGVAAMYVTEQFVLSSSVDGAASSPSTASITRSIFAGNGVGLIGPNQLTLAVDLDDVEVDSSYFAFNAAQYAAGLGAFGERLLIENSTFADNVTSAIGGGGFATVYAVGGAGGGSVTVVNSTFVDNIADVAGAIAAIDLDIYSSTFVGNRSLDNFAGELTAAGAALAGISLRATNSIFYENLVDTVPAALAAGAEAPVVNASLFTTADEVPPGGTGNIVGDPQLSELGDNGGTQLTLTLDGETQSSSIPTMLPALTSPVIDAGTSTIALPIFDQRGPGFSRVSNGAIDLGAVEIQTDAPPPPPPPRPPLRPVLPLLPNPAPVPEPAGGPTGFRSLDPVRLLDTRTGGPVQPGTVIRVPVGRFVGIDATAVALNVTALGATTGRSGARSSVSIGFVTVFDCADPIPNVSNLNFPVGGVVPTAVVSALGAADEICLVASAPTDLLVDLTGWFDGGYTAVGPLRLVDSRQRPGATRVAAGSTTRVSLPALPTGSTAAVVTVTAVDAVTAGFVSVSDCSTPTSPTTSTLNVAPGQTVAGLAITVPSSGDEICVYSSAETGLLVDLFGAFDETFTPVGPRRVLDTRAGTMPAAGSVTRIRFGGLAGVPDGADAVAVTVTAVDPQVAGYVTVYPCEATPPDTSTLNPVAGRTSANTALVGLSTGGEICVFTSGATDLLVDLSGVFTGVE